MDVEIFGLHLVNYKILQHAKKTRLSGNASLSFGSIDKIQYLVKATYTITKVPTSKHIYRKLRAKIPCMSLSCSGTIGLMTKHTNITYRGTWTSSSSNMHVEEISNELYRWHNGIITLSNGDTGKLEQLRDVDILCSFIPDNARDLDMAISLWPVLTYTHPEYCSNICYDDKCYDILPKSTMLRKPIILDGFPLADEYYDYGTHLHMLSRIKYRVSVVSTGVEVIFSTAFSDKSISYPATLEAWAEWFKSDKDLYELIGVKPCEIYAKLYEQESCNCSYPRVKECEYDSDDLSDGDFPPNEQLSIKKSIWDRFW